MQETERRGRDEQSRYPGMVVVCVEQGMLRAQVVKAKLEEADIPVLLNYESLGPIYGITVDGLGEVQVLVPAGRAAEAQALIGEPELSEDSGQPVPCEPD